MHVHAHRHTLSSPHLGFTPRANHSLFLVEFLGKWELNESTFMEIHLVSGTSIGLLSVSLTRALGKYFSGYCPMCGDAED